MNLKEVAKTFGMRTPQFSDFCGYTRQGAYDVFGGKRTNPRRFAAVLEKLEMYADDELVNQLEAANVVHRKRMEVVRQLKEAQK
jgi:hypothetical protein